MTVTENVTEQLRFDLDSTAIRLLLEGHCGQSDVTHPTRYPQLRCPIHLFRVSVKQATHRLAYSRNVGRRLVVARSNCSRMGVERRSSPTVVVTTLLAM